MVIMDDNNGNYFAVLERTIHYYNNTNFKSRCMWISCEVWWKIME